MHRVAGYLQILEYIDDAFNENETDIGFTIFMDSFEAPLYIYGPHVTEKRSAIQ